MQRTAIVAPGVPGSGTYSQAVVARAFVFVAGTVGMEMASGTWPKGYVAQMRQAIENLAAVLAEAGCGLEDVVKTTTFISPEANAARDQLMEGEQVYLRAFSTDPKPARSSPVVTLPVAQALISIEAIAVKPE